MSSSTEPSHAQAVSHQVTAFIEGLKEAIVVSMAAAAEGIRLESEVARVMQRMSAYHAVLEGIESQKQALRELLNQNRSAAEKESLRFQLKLLDQQTIAVLTRSGLPAEVAEQTVTKQLSEPTRDAKGRFAKT
ncbi:Hypothetical protein PBC10988_35050 [Planctomycetales bacterium 10988]|nr:Hypothetical protein PBC10988_35050 [Planctomycetales bacterium 10988]